MKAATEGATFTAPAGALYFGVRLSEDDVYSPMGGIGHDATVTVTYEYVTNPNENVATEGVDFTWWFKDCAGAVQQSPNHTFEVPKPCPNPPPPPPAPCATIGLPFIVIAAQDQAEWEPPELVRMKMVSAATTVVGTTAKVVFEQNYVAGGVIQDKCESGALFMYPQPLPIADTQLGLTIQVATTLPSGYVPSFSGVKFQDHVKQNYPRAASEVVAETSYLDFTIALFDDDGATGDFEVAGTLVRAPGDLDVSFKFLGEADWNVAQSGCSTPTSGWPHYASRGSIPNDFDVLRFDPVVGWVVVPFNPVTGISTVTIPMGESFLMMRFVAHDNDGPPDPSAIEVAHLHLLDTAFPIPVQPHEPNVRVGWSSDFRFLIQDNANCPE